jgi:hypothetical protein
MIVVRLIGGLGNQLFQYALGRHLAEKNSTILKLDISGFEEYKLHRYGLHCFEIWQHIATLEEIETFKRNRVTGNSGVLSKIGKRLKLSFYPTSEFYKNTIFLKENEFPFNPSVLESRGNIYLEGYWQSEKYFIAIRDILLSEFTYKYEQDAHNKRIAEQIQTTESVSIHIRRGDFVLNPLTNQVHGSCSLEYYRGAVNHIVQKKPDCHFYVFSDDQAWVFENFKLEYPVTLIDHNDASRNYEDLRLMSLCHHNIIANSSFSWWGAWLNKDPGKIVCAPERWFNDPSMETKDLIPESWVKIQG